jgi:uncharacterized protein
MKLLPNPPGELKAKLEGYLTADSRYKKIFEHTKARYEAAANLTAHNWEHSYRDTLNAIVIGEAEGADMKIVLPAITMHDIGFLYGAIGKTHGVIGAEKLPDFLKEAGVVYSEEDVKKISDCILTHKGSMHGLVPESLEAKVVADADLLEKFGPFGVYQIVRVFTEFNRTLDQYIERGKEIYTLTLQTETGKRLAEPGRQFVTNFHDELAEAGEAYLDSDQHAQDPEAQQIDEAIKTFEVELERGELSPTFNDAASAIEHLNSL